MTTQTIDEGIKNGDRSRRESLIHRRQLRAKRGSGLRKSKAPCTVCHRRACQCTYRV